MVFLPEACDYIESSTEASIKKGETLEGEFIKRYQQLAAELKIWISIGSYHRKVRLDKVYILFSLPVPVNGAVVVCYLTKN